MPRVSGKSNIFFPVSKGFFIYKLKYRNERYCAQRTWECGRVKCAAFYTPEDAHTWLDNLGECPATPIEHDGCKRLKSLP